MKLRKELEMVKRELEKRDTEEKEIQEKRAREDQRRKEEREEAARRKQSIFPPKDVLSKTMIRYNGFGSTITLDLPVSACLSGFSLREYGGVAVFGTPT